MVDDHRARNAAYNAMSETVGQSAAWRVADTHATEWEYGHSPTGIPVRRYVLRGAWEVDPSPPKPPAHCYCATYGANGHPRHALGESPVQATERAPFLMTDVLERRRGHAPVTVSFREPSTPDCTARLHRSDSAYHKRHCRCPEALAAHAARCHKPRDPDAGRRKGEAIRRWRRDRPWLHWRAPDKRVNPGNLMLLMSGFIDSPTTRERQVAVWKLHGTPNPYGTGLLTMTEIAQRVGITDSTAYRYLYRTRNQLRAERTARRHADAVWRARHKHGQRW